MEDWIEVDGRISGSMDGMGLKTEDRDGKSFYN